MGEAKRRAEQYPHLFGTSECPGSGVTSLRNYIPGKFRSADQGTMILGNNAMKRADRDGYNAHKKEVRRAA